MPRLLWAAATAAFAAASACNDQNWDAMWTATLPQVSGLTMSDPQDRLLPGWLNGTFVRNGVGQLQVGERTYTHAFDGFAGIASIAVAGGAAVLDSKVLASEAYTLSVEAGTIVPHQTLGAVSPPWNVSERMDIISGPVDNMPVNTRRSSTVEGELEALTDVNGAVHFDAATLDVTASDPLSACLYSTAHPIIASDGTAYNYVGCPATKSLSIRAERDGETTVVGEVVGVDFVPYIHSIALTDNYAVLVAMPVSMPTGMKDLTSPLFQGMDWMGDTHNATVYVFPRDPNAAVHRKRRGGVDTARPLAPVATFDVPAFVFYHIVNGYEDPDQDGTVVLDVAGYGNPNSLLVPGFGDMATMLNATARDALLPTAELFRYTLPVASGGGHVAPRVLQATDPTGVQRPYEMPRMDPRRVSKPYNFVYGYTTFADPQGVCFSAFAIVKHDLAKETALVWQTANHYPGEAVFVPRPGGTAEDDGVLLSIVLDGTKGTSYLLALDAATMEEVATLYTDGMIPVSFHSNWFGN